MRLHYRIVNVFTVKGGRVTGNPLCVFEDGSNLKDAEMQALALQFNLSETSFVMPSDMADARIRIFTPEYEMPFAGHPTLGTAHVAADMRDRGGAVALELNVGVIPVAKEGDLWEFRARASTTRALTTSRLDLASALGLSPADLGGDPLWVDNGIEQLIVPLSSEDAVQRTRPSYDRLRAATGDSLRPNAYVFSKVGDAALLSRYFFSQSGAMLEDPATGSATANLGGFFLANQARLPFALSISQGERTGRPSALRLRVDETGNVFVAGEVVELGRGYVEW